MFLFNFQKQISIIKSEIFSSQSLCCHTTGEFRQNGVTLGDGILSEEYCIDNSTCPIGYNA